MGSVGLLVEVGSVGSFNLSSTSAIHWIGSERRDTTIAGFVYKDGILLCSDTQQEGGAIKIHASKIGLFECLAGKFAFAFAGNVRFAISAIQQCRQALHEVEADAAVSTLRDVLEREYQRVVYQHPDNEKDYGAIAYQLRNFFLG